MILCFFFSNALAHNVMFVYIVKGHCSTRSVMMNKSILTLNKGHIMIIIWIHECVTLHQMKNSSDWPGKSHSSWMHPIFLSLLLCYKIPIRFVDPVGGLVLEIQFPTFLLVFLLAEMVIFHWNWKQWTDFNHHVLNPHIYTTSYTLIVQTNPLIDVPLLDH